MKKILNCVLLAAALFVSQALYARAVLSQCGDVQGKPGACRLRKPGRVGGGVLLPVKTPAATQAALNKALAQVLSLPEVRATIEAGAGGISPPRTLAELNVFLKAGSAKLQAMARAANVEPN